MKKTRSEADLQFEFAHQLRLRNIPFRLEVTFKDCRFDLVTGKDGKVSYIVEFKRISNCGKGRLKHHRVQYDKYKRFNAKLLWVFSKRSFKSALKEITGESNFLVARSHKVKIESYECLFCS